MSSEKSEKGEMPGQAEPSGSNPNLPTPNSLPDAPAKKEPPHFSVKLSPYMVQMLAETEKQILLLNQSRVSELNGYVAGKEHDPSRILRISEDGLSVLLKK
jgi:hypothetical protein